MDTTRQEPTTIDNKEDSTNATENTPSYLESFYLAEYSALREEVLKHMDIQNQLIALTLVIAGTFLSIGPQLNTTFPILLIYPILAFFLAAYWASSSRGVVRIGAYIEEKYEKRINQDKHGWETIVNSRYTKRGRISLSRLATRGIFIVTQVAAVLLSLTRFSPSPTQIGLISVDCIVIIITTLLVQGNRQLERKLMGTALSQ